MHFTTLIVVILQISATAYAKSCSFPDWLEKAPHVVKLPTAYGSGGWSLNGVHCTSAYNGGWCTYSCAPGYESVQWEPKSCYYCNEKSGVSMRTHGGLHCGSDGNLTIPFPKKPFCAPGWKGLHFKNLLSHPVSETHTVLPGFENIGYATLIEPNQTVPEYIASTEGWNGGGGPSYYISPIQSTKLALYQKDATKPYGLYSPWGLSVTYDTTTGQTFTSLGFQPEFTYTTNPPLWSKYLKGTNYMIDMQCKSTVTGKKCDSWDEYWCDSTSCVCKGGTCYGCNGYTEPSNVPTCHAVITSNMTTVTAVIRNK